jgi:hypothetical protein
MAADPRSMQFFIDRKLKNCRFTKHVFIVTTAVYGSLFTAYYDNRLENRSTAINRTPDQH